MSDIFPFDGFRHDQRGLFRRDDRGAFVPLAIGARARRSRRAGRAIRGSCLGGRDSCCRLAGDSGRGQECEHARRREFSTRIDRHPAGALRCPANAGKQIKILLKCEPPHTLRRLIA